MWQKLYMLIELIHLLKLSMFIGGYFVVRIINELSDPIIVYVMLVRYKLIKYID